MKDNNFHKNIYQHHYYMCVCVRTGADFVNGLGNKKGDTECPKASRLGATWSGN